MNTKVMLHGGFTKKDNELNRSFFEEFQRDVADSGTVLMVYFASRRDDPTEDFNLLSSRMAAEASDKQLEFTLANRKEFIEQAKSADAIYIHGGSTNNLIKILNEYDRSELVNALTGKTIAGSSAGAYALVSYGTSHDEDTVRKGLGILPARCIVHFDSPDLPPKESAVEVLKETSPELELIVLKDCEWDVREINL